MWWIIGIIILLVLAFLLLLVRSAAHSVDPETQNMIDEEQTKAVEDYLRAMEEKKKK